MEWSKVNGDVRYGFGVEGAFPRDAPDTNRSREQPPRTHMDYGPGPPLPPRPSIPPGQRIAKKPEALTYSTSAGYPFTPISCKEPRETPETHELQTHSYAIVKPTRSAMAFGPDHPSAGQDLPPFPTYNDSEQGCSSTSVCSECPTRGAPCDFGHPGVCYASDFTVRTGLRTGADGRLLGGDQRAHSAQVGYQSTSFTEGLALEGRTDLHEPADLRGPHSRHASHCDLSEFREWCEARGSRESLGILPPDLEKHLQECRCTCDHLGYGNYQTIGDGPVSHISHSHSYTGDTCSRKEQTSTVYTPISYLDSPRSTSSSGFPNRRKAAGELSNKHWWLVGLVFLVAACAGVGVGVPLALRGDPSQSLENRLDMANKILKEYPLIDGHNDLPWNIRSFVHNQLGKVDLNTSLKNEEPWGVSDWSHTDIPRLKQGRVGGVFWAAYTPCDTQYLNAVQLTLEQLDVIKRIVTKYSHSLHLVTESDEIMKAFKAGKVASMVGIEGGHAIGNSMGALRMVYKLGVRYMTLTHACHTPWATSAMIESQKTPELEYVGLNDFGRKIVLEMNRLGMMVDLSHVSTQTMRDALATSRAPVIFSHSSARALCETPRNVPDDILRHIKTNNGIVMVTFFADFIKCDGGANVTHVVDHINHIRKIAGIDHVGIGADFDGINKTPKGLEDVSKYPYLIAELLRDSSWSVRDIQKLIGGNIIRVFSEVEKIRDELFAKGVEPMEDEIHPQYLRGNTNCTYFFD